MGGLFTACIDKKVSPPKISLRFRNGCPPVQVAGKKEVDLPKTTVLERSLNSKNPGQERKEGLLCTGYFRE